MRKMRSLVFMAFAMLMVSMFFSCEKTFEEDVEIQDIVIKFSGGQNDGLKSAIVPQNVNPNNDIVIHNQKGTNFVLSAETRDGLAVKGQWEIYLNENDLSGDDYFLRENFQGESFGSIASFRADFLGKYSVFFHPEGSARNIYLGIIHEGLPGDVGDTYEHDFAFRMEKQNFLRNNETESGFTMYIKYDKNEFISWGSYNGIDPKDEKNWQALLTSNSGKTFQVGEQIYSGDNFKLKKCKFSPDYLAFTFFPSDCPPMNGDISYAVKFYSGAYGQDYWLFESQQKSRWRDKWLQGIHFKLY